MGMGMGMNSCLIFKLEFGVIWVLGKVKKQSSSLGISGSGMWVWVSVSRAELL